MSTNPIQKIEQEILATAITVVEELTVADPLPISTPSMEQKQALAGQIWLDNGGIQDDPRTLDHWLEAEVILQAGSELP